jgi:hypothetical protein
LYDTSDSTATFFAQPTIDFELGASLQLLQLLDDLALQVGYVRFHSVPHFGLIFTDLLLVSNCWAQALAYVYLVGFSREKRLSIVGLEGRMYDIFVSQVNSGQSTYEQNSVENVRIKTAFN